MKLLQGDCLELMPTLAAASVDLILCDLPYGTTSNKWDRIIPLDRLWDEYKRISRGAIVLMAAHAFTSVLVCSNLKEFKYQWVWEKNRGTGFLNAKRQPLRSHEDITVFYAKQCTYNPMMSTAHKPYKAKIGGGASNYRPLDRPCNGDAEGVRYPTTVLRFQAEVGLHPTQKPVALMEYLIKTYTNPGDTVLDNCMGSGTTGVACVNTGRKFIGIEQEATYFAIAQRRILEAELRVLES